MHPVRADAHVAILVQLDVLDVSLDGGYAFNRAFQAMARAAYDADPRRFDRIIPELILNRAVARGYALDVDVEDLALAALEACAAEA